MNRFSFNRFFLFIASLVTLFSCTSSEHEKMSLSSGDYQASLVDIDYSGYESKIDEKVSFVLYVYSPSCLLCHDFSPVLETAYQQLNFTVYRLLRSTFSKDSPLYSVAEYTPALLLFSSGTLFDNLDSTDDADTIYFEKASQLETWLGSEITFPVSSSSIADTFS